LIEGKSLLVPIVNEKKVKPSKNQLSAHRERSAQGPFDGRFQPCIPFLDRQFLGQFEFRQGDLLDIKLAVNG
jgi:hypothetical protein